MMDTATLLQAAGSGDEAALREAVAQSGVNAADDEGRHALYVAARDGQAGAVKLLLELGADIDATIQDDPGPERDSPLDDAQKAWFDDQVKELLEQLGDVDENDPMFRGVLKGIEKEAQKIRTQGPGDAESGWRYFTALRAAIRNGHVDVVESLLEGGSNVDHQATGNPVTPLQVAVMAGNTELVSLLAKAGADVDLAGDAGTTPLMEAARLNNQDMLDLLIELGADPAGLDQYRLLLAVEAGDEAAVQSHLKNGAIPNDTAPNHMSPFLAACTQGDAAMVQVMVDAGAVVTLQAVENTVLRQHFNVAEQLLEGEVVTIGSKSADKAACSVIKERLKKADRGDLWETVRDLELTLGLRKS